MTWDARQLGELTGRTVLVTGATSGIGLATAQDLVGRGAHVLLGVRDVDKGERVRASLGGRGTTSVVQLDVADLDQVAAAAKTVLDSTATLSALVCNAGLMAGPHRLSPQGFELQMATNHLGHAALVGGLWPLLQSSAARVVVVSSLAARGGRLSAATTGGRRHRTSCVVRGRPGRTAGRPARPARNVRRRTRPTWPHRRTSGAPAAASPSP